MKTLLQTVVITLNELVTILTGVNSPMFISIVSDTEVKMRKTGNDFLGVRKLSEKYRIITGFDYEQSVNNRLIKEGKEGDFEGSSNWFEVISKGLVTDKKTHSKHYLRYQYHTTSTLSSTYTVNGEEVQKEDFQQFIIGSSDYSNQGLDNPLRFQVCDLRNIREISINGYHYIIQ